MLNPASLLDPLTLDTYINQRLQEFFGPDIESFFRSATAPRPSRAIPAISGFEESEQEESQRHPRREKHLIPIDIYETEDGFVVEASVPGIPKDKIEINVDHNNVLTIEAHPTPFILHACMTKLREGIIPEERVTITKETKTKEDIPTPKESPSKEPTKEQKGPAIHKFLLSERFKGRLHRSIRLPKLADASNVQTCLESGILCLHFDRIPQSQVTRRIELR